MPASVERTNPEGVDYGRVMQLTFVITILFGAPVVAGLSLAVDLPTWEDRVSFAVRVGALVWTVTAVCVYANERRRESQTTRSDDDRLENADEESRTADEE